MNLNDILILIQKQRYSAASAQLRLHLKKNPEDANARHLLGVVFLHQKHYEKALSELRQAHGLSPRDAYILNQLSLASLRYGDFSGSREYARQALQLRSNEPGFYANLGYACEALHDYPAMFKAFRQAAERQPDEEEFLLGQATALRRQGHYSQAAELLSKAPQVTADMLAAFCINRQLADQPLPDNATAILPSGQLLRIAEELLQEGQPEKSQPWFSAYIKAEPEDSHARYLASVAAGTADASLAAAYSEQLYDTAAEEFETHLLRHLNYQGPQWLADTLSRLPAMAQCWDLGCGTGLAGQQVHQYWPDCALTGIDISQQMLAQAEQKNIYRALHHGDLNRPEFRALEIPQQALLVLLLDTLIYLPHGQELLQNLLSRLAPGSIVAFTTEEGEHLKVHNNGRMTHNTEQLLAELPPHTLLEHRQADIRTEAAEGVSGNWLVLKV